MNTRTTLKFITLSLLSALALGCGGETIITERPSQTDPAETVDGLAATLVLERPDADSITVGGAQLSNFEDLGIDACTLSVLDVSAATGGATGRLIGKVDVSVTEDGDIVFSSGRLVVSTQGRPYGLFRLRLVCDGADSFGSPLTVVAETTLRVSVGDHHDIRMDEFEMTDVDAVTFGLKL